MIQHLVDRAIQAQLREREDSEDDETEVADRGVRDQLLHVRLHHCDQGAVDDADNRKDYDPGGRFRGRIGNIGRQKRTSP